MNKTPLKICILGRGNYGLLQNRLQQLATFPTELHLVTLQPGEIDGCTVHAIRTPIPFGALKYICAIPAIRKAIRAIHPDVLDVHGISTYGAYGLYPLKQYPYLATIYGPDLTMHARNYRLLAHMAKLCFRRAARIFSSTPTTLDVIREVCGQDFREKFVARSWGIHTEVLLKDAAARRRTIREEFGVPEGTRIVLHNRQFTPFWHIDQILEAAQALLAQRSDLLFWFVCPVTNSMGKAFIEKKQNELTSAGLRDRIVLHGPQDYERMISFMHASDLYLCMGTNDQLSSSVLEAMCCGLIPVLHDLPAYHEVIQHKANGFLVPRITPQILEQQLVEILDTFIHLRAQIAGPNRDKMISSYEETICINWLMDQYRAVKNAKETLAISGG
jgi:glycosyltransferase involved in cell wall biosynthesis